VPKFQLVLLIHGHQPIGNFEDVFERSYQHSYLPFIEVLEKHPAVHLALHYTGPLLEWMERAHPEYFERVKALVQKGQVEMVGGGFYEPILISIPEQDREEQIKRLADYVEKHFGARPQGAWLAERVWEPQIPSSLAAAGVGYTLVDDHHFLGAGFEQEQLYGHYLAEDLGKSVTLLAGSKQLRYLIPFHPPQDTTAYLRQLAQQHPHGFVAMGDDLEKFGGWPGTYELCYKKGWLTDFFSELESCGDWLEVRTPAEAIRTHVSLGRADLPTASYTEMMEWALPTKARMRFHALVEEFNTRPDAEPFLRGAIWRNFFSKYSESNLLQKKMLHVSQAIQALSDSNRKEKSFIQGRDEASGLLLQAQCNDAYWHGIFGGLYAPHLRTALWRCLVEAETIVEKLAQRKQQYQTSMRLDFDGDGREEIYLTSDRYAALVKPDDGGTMPALDFRPCKTTLINSLMRRLEAYHAAVRKPVTAQSGVVSIHEQHKAKEEGLERWLHYDRWPRNAFRLLLFDRAKTPDNCVTANLEENEELAGGSYQVIESSDASITLASADSGEWLASKTLTFKPTDAGFDVECDYTLKRRASGTASLNLGLEVVVNFLAPSTTDRYFQSDGKRFPLRWTASVPGRELRVVDEWQRVSVIFESTTTRNFWIAPIDTVSESEDGFERIYQGSQVIAVSPIDLAADGQWQGKLTLHVNQI
jgi:alpha-amylase/alpha-mannosidase (GH57 family)